MIKINKILSILMDILFIVIIILLKKLNILPEKYLLILIILFLLLGIILTLLSFNIKNILGKIIILIILLISIICSIIGINIINNTDKLLLNINNLNEESLYYVIVKNNNNYNKLKDIDNKDMGVLINNTEYYNKVLDKLKKKISINEKKYNDINIIIDDLYNDKIDSMIINSNYYDLIVENIDNFTNNTKIIYKLSININSNNNNNINLNKPFNILISGIDTYGNINNVSRSDVNIVVTIDPVNHKILLTSIPRDYYVKLHTYGEYDKLTHAGIYGINESMNTIADLLDTKIDYYVRVNFDTVIKLVDEIGGIDVYSDRAFRAYNGTYFNVGYNHLDGKKALAYARERKIFYEGDRMRGKHQQQIIEAIINKISTSKVLLTNYSNIMNSMTNLIQTNISNDNIKEFVKRELDNLYGWEIDTINLDGYDSSNYTYSMPGWLLYVMKPNEETVNNAKTKINEIIK